MMALADRADLAGAAIAPVHAGSRGRRSRVPGHALSIGLAGASPVSRAISMDKIGGAVHSLRA